MSSRFPPNNSDPRYSRDRSPSGSLDSRRQSAQYNDGHLPPRNEGGYRGNDSYSYAGRGREPTRDPPKGPRAQEAFRAGGYAHRGRGAFPGRGDARDRDFRDTRDEPFGRGSRGRGQDWTSRDRFEDRGRRPSSAGRDRSRSPLSRDFARDPRDFVARDEPRRDPRDAPFSGPLDVTPLRGRGGGFRGARGRGDWRGRDDWRGTAPHLNEREHIRPRSRSRDQEWDETVRDDRDKELDFEPSRRDDDYRKERDDRDDHFRREPLYRPDSRNSTGGAPTPITSRSTSAASIRQSNLERYAQNTRDNRESLPEQRPRAQGLNSELRMPIVDRDSERADVRPRSAGSDRRDYRTASPPRAPAVPAFGSIPQRAAAISQASPMKPEPPRDQPSPGIHPSRRSLLDPSTHAPSAPKAQTFNAPTAPKAQQASERWQSRDLSERPRSLDGDTGRFSSQRQSLPGPTEPVRNISRRFSQSRNDNDTSPIRPISMSSTSAVDSAQPSVRKAVEEQGRNGNPPPQTGGSSSILRPQLSDIKIPTGPRAERVPLSIRQSASSMRGGANRGPSMMQRPGRGSATWAWVNPALPKHVPRGPSIMNTVPTKRDSIGDDKTRAGPPSAESTEDAVAKWKRDHAPASIITTRAPRDHDHPLDSPRSASLIHKRDRVDAEDAVKMEASGNEQSEPDNDAAEDEKMDWGEEDFAKGEELFESKMKALEARRPPTPRSNTVLLNLLDDVDALASALEEKSRTAGQDVEPLARPRPSDIPSPKADDGDEMDIKREPASPSRANVRPSTPPVESLPFLASGIPIPFSEIQDLQENTPQQTAVEAAIRRQLEKQARTFEAQIDEARNTFVQGFREWKRDVEEIESKPGKLGGVLNVDDTKVSPVQDEVPCFDLPTPLVGRRIKNASELDFQEVMRVSQETAAKEELARREKDPVYVSPITFNREREADVPAMLSEDQRKSSTFIDTNALIQPDFVLGALEFIPKEDDFTPAEQELFLVNYVHCPKRFGTIADALDGRDFRDCVQHYYLTKRIVKYKDQEAAFLKTTRGKKLAKSAMRSQIRPKAGLIASFDGMIDLSPQATALTEKGRPRRAAAPTFGEVGEAEPAITPTPTPFRRGAPGRDPTVQSAEKSNTKRTRTKEKGGRKAKAPLLAAAPGPSPQKGTLPASQNLTSEPVLDSEQRLSVMETAEALAGLGNAGFSNQSHAAHLYLQGPSLAWSTEHQVPLTSDTIQQPSQQFQDPSLQNAPKAATSSTTSSYWSVPEVHDFNNYVRYFGTNWHDIAATMKTKTPTMIRNYYNRRIGEGDAGKQLEVEVKGADEKIQDGQDMGPLPLPTPTGEKRRYQYNQQREFQRPLAPSVESTEVDDSPKFQPNKVQAPARFKQEQARFTTQPTSDQGLEQVSLQLQSQGMKSIENRPVIMPSSKPVPQQQQILGQHLGTFVPEERHRAYYSTRDPVPEREQKEMQNRPPIHETQLQAQLTEQTQQQREPVQRQQLHEGHTHLRNRLSQHHNEQPVQTFQQHTPHVLSNPPHALLMGQQTSVNAQAGAGPSSGIELTVDDKAKTLFESRVQQHQQQQQQQQKQQQQQVVQQQQAVQQPYMQQRLQQHQPRIDTSASMRRLGPFGNAVSQHHSPASASLPPMSPPGEPLRPSSVPVNTSAPSAPPGPPKKSSIMDLLNSDAPDPPPRKRLSDQQRPAAPTPPPQQSIFQPASQQIQPQIHRYETPTDAMMHMQLQQRPPSFSQPTQHTQQIPPPPPPPSARERNPNWAVAAQQMQQLQQRPYLDDRSAQAQVISPQSQPSFLPSRNSIQALQQQRSHGPSPPPQYSQHTRGSSYTTSQQMQKMQQQHQQQQQQHYVQHLQQQRPEQQHQSLPSTPAEPNIRPSPYASLNPSQQTSQQPHQAQSSLQQRLEIEKRAVELQEQRHHALMQEQEQAQRQAQSQATQHQNPLFRMQQHQQEQEIARRQSHISLDQDILQRGRQQQHQFDRTFHQQLERERERREREERERNGYSGTFDRNGQGR